MIHRKIYRVETIGARATHDLRPKLSDDTPQGINYRVLEYDEPNHTCTVEAWCSDHTVLKPKHRKDMTALNQLLERADILETLSTHEKSPQLLGRISVTEILTGPHGQGSPDKLQRHLGAVDKAQKKITWKGKTHSYMQRKEGTDTIGRNIVAYVLDEG